VVVVHSLCRDRPRPRYLLFDEILDVEIEPETLGKESGTDSDTTYEYRYGVYLTLKSGERFLLRRCASSEPSKTQSSQELRDAEWSVRYLRGLLDS